MLYVDQRWNGRFGIGRYSSEVISRLGLQWAPLSASGKPSGLRDILTPRMVDSGSLIYSPGFNAGCSAATQFITVHDLIHLTTRSILHTTYYERILRPVVMKAGLVFTVSSTSSAAIEEWLGGAEVEIVNTGNGVSEVFVPADDEFHQRSDYVLFVGNLKSHKNIQVVLKAMKKLSNLRLIGVVPIPQELDKMAADFGVTPQVTALSGLSDVELCQLYRDALVTVVPSLIEGFGLPAAESLCVSTPVVYWNGCSSVREIVGSNGIGILESDNPEEWANGIRSACGARVDHEAVRNKYSWDAVGDRVERALKWRLSS